jgi:diacylglycerol kinase family enzyme
MAAPSRETQTERARFAPGQEGERMPPADLCVIFNPTAGRKRATGRLEGLRRSWGGRADFWPTRGPGDAEELASRAARAGFRIVAAAGGDGTVHEVANGLLAAARPEVNFAIIPVGSANDYAHSLGLDRKNGTPAESASLVREVDVGVVSDPSTGRQRYFVCCLGLGLNGAVTLESRRIKRLQGMALYGLATLRALWYHYACPVMDLSFDGEPTWSVPTLMLSVLLGRREGGFVLAPDAKLDDGLFDYVHAGRLSRWEVLRFLPRVARWGPPHDHPKVRLGRCRTLRVHSQVPLTVHLDGEFFATPLDEVCDLDIRLLPRLLRVQTVL